MGRDKDFIDCGRRVLVKAEWIEGGCWISVEQRGAQRIAVHVSANALSAIIFAITKSAFPVPTLKVIAKLTQITFETAGELVVMGCNLVGPQPRFQTSVTHAGRELGSGRHSAYFSCRKLWIRSSGRGVIRHSERIERVLNRHANALETYPKWVSCIREYVRRKRGRHQRAVPEGAHILKITEKLQVLAVNFAIERAIQVFTVH